MAAPAPALDVETDPFAEGHEDRTPPELYAIRPGGGPPDTPGWRVRVVPNLYPALSDDAPDPPRDANQDLFWAGAARGGHEVIINAPDPVISLSELSDEQVGVAVDVWRARMREHADAAYVHVIVNERREAGSLASSYPRPATMRFRLCPPMWLGSESGSAPTPPGQWAATCWPTWSRRRSGAESGSSRSTMSAC